MQLFNKSSKSVFLKEDSDTDKYIAKLIDLQKKATGNIRDKIDLEIKLASIGQFGEKNIAFELKNSGIPMYILHDIYLEVDDLTAQIDYIVVTEKIIFVLECKNLIGDITIDKDGNFIRDYQLGKRKIREGIYSPITQNARHLELLRQIRRTSKNNIISKFLFDKYFDDNYKSLVVLANPKTIINDRYAKKEIKDMIIRADQLIKYIKDANTRSDLPSSNDDKMRSLAIEILSLHRPNKSDYTRKYKSLLEDMNNNQENRNESIDAFSNKKEDLYRELKTFRLDRSREEGIRAYYIFTDAQLMDLIDKLPNNKAGLRNILGFGDLKVEKYGDDILKIINGD